MSSKTTPSDRHIIWGDINLDYEDWREDLEAEYPDLTDDERYYKMLEINGDYLDDERVNLNIQLSQPIFLIHYSLFTIHYSLILSPSPLESRGRARRVTRFCPKGRFSAKAAGV